MGRGRALIPRFAATNDGGGNRKRLLIYEHERLQPMVRRIVSSVCRGSPDMADAEDLVSDTLIGLLRRLRE